MELIHCLKLKVKFLQLVEPWGARLHCRDNLTQRALIDRLDTSRTCNLSIHLSTNLIARLDKKVLHDAGGFNQICAQLHASLPGKLSLAQLQGTCTEDHYDELNETHAPDTQARGSAHWP